MSSSRNDRIGGGAVRDTRGYLEAIWCAGVAGRRMFVFAADLFAARGRAGRAEIVRLSVSLKTIIDLRSPGGKVGSSSSRPGLVGPSE